MSLTAENGTAEVVLRGPLIATLRDAVYLAATVSEIEQPTPSA